MDIIENATQYGRVRTPSGYGNVLKMTMHDVSVQMDDTGEVMQFKQNEVQSVPDRRAITRPTQPKNYSFSADQVAAGHNTRLLK